MGTINSSLTEVVVEISELWRVHADNHAPMAGDLTGRIEVTVNGKSLEGEFSLRGMTRAPYRVRVPLRPKAQVQGFGAPDAA